MKATGRFNPSKASQGSKEDFLATQSGDTVAKEARIRELRELIASGRYEIETEALAQEIMRRASKPRRRRSGH